MRISFTTQVNNVAGRFENVQLRRGSGNWPTNWPEIIITGNSGTNGNIEVQGGSFSSGDVSKAGLPSLSVIDVQPSSTVHLSPTSSGMVMAKSSSSVSQSSELVVSLSETPLVSSPSLSASVSPFSSVVGQTSSAVTSSPSSDAESGSGPSSQSASSYISVTPVLTSDETSTVEMTSIVDSTSPIMKVTSSPPGVSPSLSIKFGVTSTTSLPTLQTSTAISSSTASPLATVSPIALTVSDGAATNAGWIASVSTLGALGLLVTADLIVVGVSGKLCASGSMNACKVFKWASVTIGSRMEFYKTAVGVPYKTSEMNDYIMEDNQ